MEMKNNVFFFFFFRLQNYMGASFQAPHAAPRQRQMETHHVSLIYFVFQYAFMTNHTGMYKMNKNKGIR